MGERQCLYIRTKTVSVGINHKQAVAAAGSACSVHLYWHNIEKLGENKRGGGGRWQKQETLFLDALQIY